MLKALRAGEGKKVLSALCDVNMQAQICGRIGASYLNWPAR